MKILEFHRTGARNLMRGKGPAGVDRINRYCKSRAIETVVTAATHARPARFPFRSEFGLSRDGRTGWWYVGEPRGEVRTAAVAVAKHAVLCDRSPIKRGRKAHKVHLI